MIRAGRRGTASDSLLELWEDCPDYPRAVEFADEFEAAVNESHGNRKRFTDALHHRA